MNRGVSRSLDDYNSEINHFIRRGERRYSDMTTGISPTHSRNGSASPRRFSEPVVTLDPAPVTNSMPSELEPHFEEDEEEEQEEDEDEEEEEEEIETQATNHHSERYFLEGENGIDGDESFYLNNEGALEVEAKSCETKEVVCP